MIEFGELCDLLHSLRTGTRVAKHLEVPVKSIYSALRQHKMTVRRVLRETPLPLERAISLAPMYAGTAASQFPGRSQGA